MKPEQMEAGEALDRLVLERVFGMNPRSPDLYPKGYCPEFSTDIAAAWALVQRLVQPRPDGFALYYRGRDLWQVVFFPSVLATGPTACLALCRGALLAVAKRAPA